MPSATRLRGVGGVERRARTLASVVATDVALLARRATAAAGAAQAVERELVGIADPDEHRGLGPQLPRGRHRERLAQLALEAGLGEERREPAAERGVDDVGAGAETPRPSRSGTASSSAATRSAGVVTTVNVRDTVSSGVSGSW